ncbi:tyrosine-type recombinase/integrase [Actinoplanes sp. NEAU-A11]|uniref:Tyrosine-type recombinase/integrase n=2 Tax=Actinoplanes aureus TaxID=2792083 RepID=A0A931CQ79_9ACTN|nr:tyrosine-type recombinase/integrase [Actinoplanes aureus]MBG0569095.1 tyrosine-type recombinase/integrase [Actinoplanes aureus]
MRSCLRGASYPLSSSSEGLNPLGDVVLDLQKVCHDVAPSWFDYLRDWDRTLRGGNYPETTRYNYLLAGAQLGRYLRENADELAAVDAAGDPTEVERGHVEEFQAWMVRTRSASTALNKHKGLQQFFKWLVEEEDLERSPLARVKQPKTGETLIPILGDEETAKILATCKDKTFLSLRDEAIIRVFFNTGARLSEVAGLLVDDVDLDHDTLLFHGKGMKDRRVRFGGKAGRALSRYLRARARRRFAESPVLWLPEKGETPLAANGIKIMLRRRGELAGVAKVHAHRWRHNFAHEWKLAGGDTGDLMLVLGWASDDMPRRYGASAAAERAQQVHARLRIGDRV